MHVILFVNYYCTVVVKYGFNRSLLVYVGSFIPGVATLCGVGSIRTKEEVKYVLITFSIARSANLPVFSFAQRPILRFFALQGRHVAPMGVKFGTGEGTFGPLLLAKFHPHRCNDKGV